jgi:cold shock CspA family protein
MSDTTYTGKVKWFNKKSGYGFITVACNCEKKGTDYFVHHSSIKLSGDQYKYLVEGEYVEFKLVDSENDNYKYQCDQVSGINGGSLMCETINNKPKYVHKTEYVDKQVKNKHAKYTSKS